MENVYGNDCSYVIFGHLNPSLRCVRSGAYRRGCNIQVLGESMETYILR